MSNTLKNNIKLEKEELIAAEPNIEPYYLPFKTVGAFMQFCSYCTYKETVLFTQENPDFARQHPFLKQDLNSMAKFSLVSLYKNVGDFTKITPRQMLHTFKEQELSHLISQKSESAKKFFYKIINEPSEREMQRLLDLQYILGSAIKKGLVKHLAFEKERLDLIKATKTANNINSADNNEQKMVSKI